MLVSASLVQAGFPHQLSTIIRADQIVVLDRGRVVEPGPPREQLAHRGKTSCALP